ncbi:ubiquitin carboxyl-terminal hydrolase [Theileria orientalis strain Shintoku]|uniref:Ubiquitin carboxyl-terminal hydrolase n=1 Tax=Theileria orientalis strain Shintoku TaxID=869250 RepID=J4C8D1_THEOR|nr:ubiquitin carboxyl-terminal hydrolase [Theileria orientalis strain Shintoku]PVC51722.1 ubiquitin carboxyl-terminal hydrolase [Theileria orientalis]BAM40578.1 ubiquitin carboxyl-terminal hydrolase [Theileria orientalis strain Shintoku]|eukprot:XP_009690879.1 ubiquitin carboxyl-terminal hydrolase [Theileria orientalis strain Shintoku]
MARSPKRRTAARSPTKSGSKSPIKSVTKSVSKTMGKLVNKIGKKLVKNEENEEEKVEVVMESTDKVEAPNVHDSERNVTENGKVEKKSMQNVEAEVGSNVSLERKCPYLGTINRHLLDFDFEKVCSITLTNIHVYACLVCGKYFQGRGKNTHCYTHALEECHYLFMNLEDCKVYCIPENYLVEDASLDDIKYFLKPSYTRKDVELLKTQVTYGKALDGTDFIPGCIGLNNLKKTDYFNVIIQMMCVVTPLRDLFLLFDVNKVQPPDAVITTMVQLIRKIFNTRNFKGIVSPHEFVQSVGVASNGVYKIGVQSDPASLFSWLLARIHQKLQNRNTKESVVTRAFGGELLVKTLRGTRWESERKPFRMLTLVVPEAPIFKDSMDTNAIPQVPIFDLLAKYDGKMESVNTQGEVAKYKLSKLPEYLVLVIKRFTKNNFFLEKNPTIVSFPMKNLDLSEYMVEGGSQGGGNGGSGQSTKYDLICNISHEGTPKGGTFKVQVYHTPSNNWFQMEDLLVTSILPQQVALTECVCPRGVKIGIYGKRRYKMDDEQFDLYEGLENFEESPQSEPEVEYQEEKAVISDDEDDFNLVVDDEDAVPQQEVKPAKKTKRSIYTRKYRIFFVGAPGETHEAPMSNIEFFVLLKKLPIWIDDAGLMEYVKNITSGVAYAKVLYNQYHGKPLGIGLVEFKEISACTTFLKHKSHIASTPMPPQVYTHMSSDYRHGIVSETLIKAACRILSVPYTSSSSFCTSQQDMIEIEYERQQEELVKNGEYEIVTKTFPWFSYDLVSIMGACNRMMAPKEQSKPRRNRRGPITSKSEHALNKSAANSANRAFHGGQSGKAPGNAGNSRSSSASTTSVHLESYLSSKSMEGMGEKLTFLNTMLQSGAEGKPENAGVSRESTGRADATAKRDMGKHESGNKHVPGRPTTGANNADKRSPERKRPPLTVRKAIAKAGQDRDHKAPGNRDKGVKAREKSRKRNFEQMRADRSPERQEGRKPRRERSPGRRDRGKKRDKGRHEKGLHRNPEKRR